MVVRSFDELTRLEAGAGADQMPARVFYLAAQVAAQHHSVSRQYYQRKRSEGKNHKQAVLALARRRLNVLWALLRDGRTFERRPPVSHTAAA